MPPPTPIAGAEAKQIHQSFPPEQNKMVEINIIIFFDSNIDGNMANGKKSKNSATVMTYH